MNNTAKKLTKVLTDKPVNNIEKLKRQQEYYKRLVETGTAKKQTYNLKPRTEIEPHAVD